MEINKTNLRTLARFLLTVAPEKFNMRHWVQYMVEDEELPQGCYAYKASHFAKEGNNCGFSACAMGWAAVLFGDDNEQDGEDSYRDLMVQLFSIHYEDNNGYTLFNPLWSAIDNTPEAAAKRIFFYLDTGKDLSVVHFETANADNANVMRGYQNEANVHYDFKYNQVEAGVIK